MSTAKRLVLSWRGRKQSHDSSVGRLVGHGGGSALGPGDNHELDEIAVVSSNADPCHVKYGSGTTLSTINGPRLVPGIITSGGGCMVGERLSSSGTCLNVSPPVQGGAPATAPHKASTESVHRVLKSVSRQSLLDLVGCKLGMSKSRQPQSYHQQRYFSSSHDSISTSYINRAANVSSAASELDLSRKARRKDLRGRLKLPTSVTLASSGEAPLLGAWRTAPGSTAGTNPPSTNHLNSTSSCNGTESRYGFRRGESYSSRLRTGSANWSFVFDPAGRLCYYWSMVVSLAFLYNFWVIIYRFAFREIDANTILVWFCLDYFADFLYLVDIMFHFRTGYLEDGVLQTDSTKLRHHYMNSTTFYIDCLCLLPLDFLYLSVGFNSILRSFRLVKIYRFWAFMDRTERHTNYPNLFRSTSLIHYLLVIFHWNGCLFHIILKNDGFGSKNWVYSDSESTDYVKAYLQSYYWCTLALTTIGDLPRPRNKGEYLFVIFQLLFGLLLFATVLGHVANIVTSVSAARKEFQDNSAISKLDGVKTYMRMRRVPNHLQVKVIKWFDYLWLTQKCSDEERAVSCLPDKLKAEIAINVHLDTLKRVEIFQNTEAGFLCELVLRLRPVLFSPGDYICRKGEVGKEMYIVNRGRLQVVADNGRTVLATLKAGSYFGEISILNMGTAGNRRTASVRSVGYSDLFVLSKKDMWDVLKEYPAARVRLEAIAVKRLEKYKRAPLEKAAMGRSQSTPGLVESRGKVPLEDMWVPPALVGFTPAYPRSLMGSPPRPVPDSPLGSTSSGRSHHHTPASHARSGTTLHCDSMTQLVSGTASPLLGSHEALESEIKRLRERLHTVETENAAMSEKLNQQQWELENRLAEIEMQICGSRSTSSLEDNERNRESII
ncbi:cyclic nucleotide-gated channel rod photoreceptor subunit alpha isoform X2 [Tribolium castaneum]|uniref:cyclic nucleotide-gated channel rod photoreceptor subunit alpha isoform X2 n=1 Tax=Tribolium castaneum TaxID=7070 RepID=UPI00077DABAF|nr:PREDICTED: cyclic nucleotide-gated channel rod photoreceptor subunit alpha isoform X2 [Tribolium castaneum]|eukprot:XP_015835561.1 PREDICTED: cyclic nucleotide-gated channel rod photoreceptor subunit alpha isoform X2 [Tribolium castaneum]